jgi:dihydroorotase
MKNGLIYNIDSTQKLRIADQIIDLQGKLLTPGCIDDQVHFREPGLTHKATIATESRAAVAGGITSYMEMPNTLPAATTHTELEKKYAIAARTSAANYSFYLGATNDNLSEITNADYKNICGVKIFMGSSTGSLVVDNEQALENIFAHCPTLIATHCEDDHIIQQNFVQYNLEYGINILPRHHPHIRTAAACWASSSKAVAMAKKHGSRLHVLHISTADELQLFEDIPLTSNKKITAECCVHHLWFCDDDYTKQGNYIKWNPAIKTDNDRTALQQALNTHKIDVIATDHAPHTIDEKQQPYAQAPSGAPMVQHSWVAMLQLHKQGKISIENIVRKMCHNPAILFNIQGRGFIQEGFFADVVVTDMHLPQAIHTNNLLYKCGWSPMQGVVMDASVVYCFVNGNLAYHNGKLYPTQGARLVFDR